ncbi:hypothetical protein ACHMW6_06335 [Pseudoduganella sp. UC29_106]|uniref:hypothetical protein n=1 Tax=Pseudoduganella sp. UC29_106 TaxID=3374553 RepID=UPI0037583B2D
MSKEPEISASDAAALIIFGIGAILIALAMWSRPAFDDIVGEILRYCYVRRYG